MHVDVIRLIEEMLGVVRQANQNVTIQNLFSDDTAVIQAERGPLEMVLLSLFLSAADAMPDGGRLTVSCRRVMSADNADSRSPGCGHGGLIEIIVADTAADTQGAIQDRATASPSATRPAGHATRMSPASLHRAVQNLNGRIQTDAVPGQGTTRTLVFPAAEVPSQDKAPAPGQKSDCSGSGTILLVEDEPLILKYCREMIHSLGFETLIAADGATAIQVFRENNQRIDLVMLDMMLPGLDGLSVLSIVKEINPDPKIIIISGAELPSRINQVLPIGSPYGYLKKPFTLDELSGEIDRVLACSGPCAADSRAATSPRSR
jgi:two-component system cell cycle sensor histidine kinase/response regulator CckA